MRVEVDVSELQELRQENKRLRARVTELQAGQTALVFHRRAHSRQTMVREFMTAGEQPFGLLRDPPPDALVRFRFRLVLEEFLELLDATFGEWRAEPLRLGYVTRDLWELASKLPIRLDLPELVDATVDLDYVVEGFRQCLGVDSDAAWAEVHAANMRKFPDGRVYYNAEGKVGKPPGWVGPDVVGLLRAQGWAA